MKLPAALQKKGIFTVTLVVATESMTFSNAVHFWSTYQSWSNRYGNGRHNFQKNDNQDDHFKKGFFFSRRESQVSQSQDGSLEDTTCTVGSTTSSSSCSREQQGSTNVLHPRKLNRVTTTVVKASTCNVNSAYDECCRTKAPSCKALLDVRGGHGTGTTIPSSAAEAAAEAIFTTTAHSAGLPTPYNLSLNLWKVIFQIFLTAMNVACWLIPLRAKKMTENKLALGLANAFSGGVFLSLAFGHLIPECIHGFEGMNEVLPFMIVLGGYLLIFFVEKVAFDAHGLMHECGADHGTHGGPNKEIIETNNKNRGSLKQASGESATVSGNGTGRSAVILLGALAVHSILEMTALGLARSFGDSALLTLSIALHQVSE
jgi:Predicted divalent heavy-metal cations transporter